MLIDKGANINVVDDENNVPALIYAAKNGTEDLTGSSEYWTILSSPMEKAKTFNHYYITLR